MTDETIINSWFRRKTSGENEAFHRTSGKSAFLSGFPYF